MRAIFALLVATNVLMAEIFACTLLNILPQLPICNGSRRYNMEKCILENLVWLNPYISQGIPSLNIPPYKSYHIAEYYDVHARSPNHKSTWINDLRLRGLMDYQISRVTVSPYQSDQIAFLANFPHIHAVFYSHMDMNIFNLLSIKQTNIDMFIENTTADISISGEYYTRDGERYFKATNVAVTLTYDYINVTYGRKDYILHDVVEILSTERLPRIMMEVRPRIEQNAADIIKELANKFYSNCPT